MARKVESAGSAVARTVSVWRARLGGSRRLRLLASWLRRGWSTLLVVVLALVMGFAALINKGVEATDLHLNEGSVYVQNQNRAMVGMLNYQIDSIAAATTVGDTASTLLQEGRVVLVHNAGSSTLQIYDPAANSLSAPVTPPAGALLSLNNGVLSVTNPENGKVWFGPVDEIARSDFRGSADLDLHDLGQAVVTAGGQVIGLNVQDSTIVRPDGSAVKIPFQVDNTAATAQLSAIGDRAVVLDRVSQQIWIEGERQAVAISGSDAQLAPPMADSAPAGRGGSIVYATKAGLNTIRGGSAQSLSGRMDASHSVPVTVGNCAYGAFTARVVKVCGGGEAQVQDIPELPDGARLSFQVNRGTVVLQDTNSGMVWLVDKGMKIVNNWDQVTPRTDDRMDDPDQIDDRVILPDRTGPNRNPIAQDDPSLGARVGRSTVLPILDNDSDEDGDIITVTDFSEIAGGPTLQLTGNGSGLQITMPEDAAGSYQFTYTINDGRGGTAYATATVQALAAAPEAGNRPPVNIRPGETTVVTSGTTVSRRALLTWRDPDGDELVLVNAQPETSDSEDEVTFTPDGTISFRDVGKLTGPKLVRVWVSDGVATTEGQLLLDVRKREAAPPIANGDFVSTIVNREVVVTPLANDEGNNLLLTEVDQSTENYTVLPNFPDGTFRFRATAAGTYYLVYKVNNGAVSTGLIRIDVAEQTTENHTPVAVRDTALVPFGGSVVIDPLLNDTDADNDVLVVQSISRHDAVNVVMQERHLLTISMITQTQAPVALTYWVSDGRNSTRGTIVVFPASQYGNPVPRAVNDNVKVRAGATVSVPVLNNDTSPIGLPIGIVGLPANPMGDRAWVDGDRVRIAVPKTAAAATLPITYQIADSSGRTDSATIFVNVISQDAQNEAPTPPLAEARVLSNSVTRIPVRMAGMDPNGDSVRLLGLGSGPSLGRVIEIGDGWLRYESYPDSRGTDSFRYQVIDSFGAVGTGEIRIGVAPPSDDNTGPTGVPDEVTVRPGRSLTLPVLANDYDIDGDQFGFQESDAIRMDFPAGIVNNQYISVTAPQEAGDYLGSYQLMDRRGSPGTGTVSLHVDPAAPLLAPTALDDQLTVNDVLDREWVDVDVLANDFDTDGPHDQLTVSLPPSAEGEVNRDAVVADGKLRVRVGEAMQQVRYVITDADGKTAQALALVPGRRDSVPVLADPSADYRVEAGQIFTINFETMIRGTGNREVRLTSPDTVRATKGVVNPRAEGIDFQSDVRYAGPASVVFEVIDASETPDDPAKRAFVAVPITVTPAQSSDGNGQGAGMSNRAPEGPGNVVLEVGAGEAEQRFPLRGRFTDPEGDNFSFQSWSQLSGDPAITWTASVGGDVITASAAITAKGRASVLQGMVVDAFGASRQVSVTIQVVGSTRPLPVAQADVVEDANAGQSRNIDVLANDKSFLDDQTLTVVSAAVVSGGGTASVSGNRVDVTPANDYVGLMTARYTIMDATQDPGRQVDGAIELTVRSRPAAPGTPTIENEGDKQVTIKWTSNSNNGMPITGRTVTATGSNGSRIEFTGCASNTCTVTGLTNNVGYTFAVTEANELGTSDSSNPSAVGTPDVRPPALAQPILEFPGPGLPGQLRLRWAEPVFEGSPVTGYTIKEANGKVADIPVTAPASSHDLKGLTNYETYSFYVTATNNKGTSDLSPLSNVDHPSGAPPKAPAPTVADTDAPDGSRLRVAWTLPSGHPDPWTNAVLVLQGGGHTVEQPLGAPTENAGGTEVSGLHRRVRYQAFIRLSTRGGTTDGEQSAPILTTAAPEVPVTGHLTASGPDQLTATVDDVAGRDWDKVRVILWSDGIYLEEAQVLPGQSVTFTRFAGFADQSGYRALFNTSMTGIANTPAGDKRAVKGQDSPERIYAFGTPKLMDVRLSGYAGDQSWNIDHGWVDANGTSEGALTYSYTTSAGDKGAFYWDKPLHISTGGVSGSLTLTVCDGERPGNCGNTSIDLPAPMTATAAGRTVTVRFGKERGMHCRVDGLTEVAWVANGAQIAVPGTASVGTVICSTSTASDAVSHRAQVRLS